MNTENRARFIKKLLYQSSKRGCKETDIIIGQFAEQNVRNMSDEELEAFSIILEENDSDLYDRYVRKIPVPQGKLFDLMNKILKFSPNA